MSSIFDTDIDFNAAATASAEAAFEEFKTLVGQLIAAVKEVQTNPSMPAAAKLAYIRQLCAAGIQGGTYLLSASAQQEAAAGKPVLSLGSPSTNGTGSTGSTSGDNDIIMGHVNDIASIMRQANPEDAVRMLAEWLSALSGETPAVVNQRMLAMKHVAAGNPGYEVASDGSMVNTRNMETVNNRVPNYREIITSLESLRPADRQARVAALLKVASGEIAVNPDGTVDLVSGVPQTDHDTVVGERDAAVTERDALRAELDALKAAVGRLNTELRDTRTPGTSHAFQISRISAADRTTLAGAGMTKVR